MGYQIMADVILRKKSIYFIPVISGFLFMFETIYTRVLSVILYNNYVYLVISLAIIGYGIGSYLFNYIDKKKSWVVAEDLFAVTTILITFIMLVLIYFLPFLGFWLYLFPISIPFILAGFIYTKFYSENLALTGLIYALDLAGAVSGMLIGYLLINMFGMVQMIMFIGISGFLILTAVLIKRRNIISIIPLTTAVILLFLINIDISMNWINRNFNSYLTSPVTTLFRLKDSGSNYKILDSKWDIFSRTDVLELEGDSSERIVTIDGAANASMVKSVPGGISPMFLMGEIDFLPYVIRNVKNAAIIGSGGGRDVKQALLGGVTSIDAIEINRSSIDLTNKMGDYTGDIYGDEKVNVYITDGRNFIEKTENNYDLIYLSMVMTGASQAEGLLTAEMYIYTREAISSYMKKLSDNGLLTFVTHGIQDMSKILKSLSDILLESGITKEDIHKYIIVAANPQRHGKEVMISQPVIIYSPDKFTDLERSKTLYFLSKIKAMPIMVNPKIDNPMFVKLLKGENIDLPFSYKPATDEKPYFYNYTEKLPQNILVILIVSLVITALLWGKKIFKSRIFGNSVYISFSGMAFMLVEIVLIQKMSLLLGHTSIAFVLVITTVLSGAGAGGLYSQKKVHEIDKFSPLAVGVLLILSTIGLVIFKEWIMEKELIVKIFLLGIPMFIISFFQGNIFPSAIKRLKSNTSIYYGINSCFSLIGSILAMILLIKTGSSISLLIGALIYIIIFLIRPITIMKN